MRRDYSHESLGLEHARAGQQQKQNTLDVLLRRSFNDWSEVDEERKEMKTEIWVWHVREVMRSYPEYNGNQ